MRKLAVFLCVGAGYAVTSIAYVPGVDCATVVKKQVPTVSKPTFPRGPVPDKQQPTLQ